MELYNFEFMEFKGQFYGPDDMRARNFVAKQAKKKFDLSAPIVVIAALASIRKVHPKRPGFFAMR